MLMKHKQKGGNNTSSYQRFLLDINRPIATAATVRSPVPTPTPIKPSFTIASSTADFNSAA